MMDPMLTHVNWPAVLLGTVAAYGLGMVWFGKIFGRVWASGSHNISPPARPSMIALVVQLVGTFLMAWLIGATETQNALVTALIAIFAIAALQFGGALFSQKRMGAALVDGGFIVAMGVVMIAAQAIL